MEMATRVLVSSLRRGAGTFASRLRGYAAVALGYVYAVREYYGTQTARRERCIDQDTRLYEVPYVFRGTHRVLLFKTAARRSSVDTALGYSGSEEPADIVSRIQGFITPEGQFCSYLTPRNLGYDKVVMTVFVHTGRFLELTFTGDEGIVLPVAVEEPLDAHG